MRDQVTDPILKEVLINDVPIQMEVDTGASVTVVTEDTYQKIREGSHNQTKQLQQSTVRLKTYTGEAIPVLGQVPVKVSCGQNTHTLVVQVVKPDLMGRNWLAALEVTLTLPAR